MLLRKSAISVLASTLIVLSNVSAAEARDQIQIVGSSTVYPFSSAVAEEFGATTSYG